MNKLPVLFVAILSQLTLPVSLHAQGTLADYQRAYRLQRELSWAKVTNHVDDARWLTDGRFQYHVTDGGHGLWHFGQVNPDGTVTLADTTATTPIESPTPRHRGDAMRGGHVAAVTFVANPSKRRHQRHWMETDDERDGDPVLSPDSSLCAFIRNDNVYVSRPDGSEARQLTTEGTISHYFSSYLMWSPDGRYLAASRIRPVEKRYVHYVESSPSDQLQPVLHKQEYAKPGDELPQRTPYIIEVATGRTVCPEPALITNQYSLSMPEWRADSRAIRFDYNQRGHHLYRVYEMEVPAAHATSVSVSAIIEEREEKYVRYSNYFRRSLRGDSLILWLSERDGYPHLYLFSPYQGAASKGAKSSQRRYTRSGNTASSMTESTTPLQLTSGPWCVRQVLHIDEERGLVFFTACGRNPGEDPYNLHYYSIGLDGTCLTDLTPEAGNHSARFNASYTALIDTYSTVDTAPTTVVSVFGTPTAAKAAPASTILATADISALQAAGWVAPEPFVAPGRDGKTPMYGIVQRPSNFDPSKKYPVIEYIYAGPGDSYTPKSFSPYNWYTTSLAELGFIVVQLDAMGTSNRGKRFEEVCYKNLKDAGFPDRIAWIRAAAAKYPYMDIDRVGIYGCSAGGQESTAALLFHGDFYKAAYSACGCHDNRMDKIWWNEQWMSYPVDSSYIECSNIENAARLTRPLMLVVGELDDNVDPSSTMQLSAALTRANKDFDLVVIPGARHTMGEAYGEHKRYDFFVRHLLNVTPPAWSELHQSPSH